MSILKARLTLIGDDHLLNIVEGVEGIASSETTDVILLLRTRDNLELEIAHIAQDLRFRALAVAVHVIVAITIFTAVVFGDSEKAPKQTTEIVSDNSK